jgi:poly(hydroxyalkanoate) granule-associated protein
MATAKKTAKPATETADMDVARKIWLAGVGAYGRMFSETQGAVEKLAAGANEAFDQLVAKGEEVEDKVRDSIAKSPQGERVVSLVEATTTKVQAYRAEQRTALDARIGKVRKAVAETLAPWNNVALGQAVEKLTAQVETLTKEVAALKTEKVEKAEKVVVAVAASAPAAKTVKAPAKTK